MPPHPNSLQVSLSSVVYVCVYTSGKYSPFSVISTRSYDEVVKDPGCKPGTSGPQTWSFSATCDSWEWFQSLMVRCTWLFHRAHRTERVSRKGANKKGWHLPEHLTELGGVRRPMEALKGAAMAEKESMEPAITPEQPREKTVLCEDAFLKVES